MNPVIGLDVSKGESHAQAFLERGVPRVQAKIISEQLWAWKHHDNNEHLWTHALRTADKSAADKFESLFTSKSVQ